MHTHTHTHTVTLAVHARQGDHCVLQYYFIIEIIIIIMVLTNTKQLKKLKKEQDYNIMLFVNQIQSYQKNHHVPVDMIEMVLLQLLVVAVCNIIITE